MRFGSAAVMGLVLAAIAVAATPAFAAGEEDGSGFLKVMPDLAPMFDLTYGAAEARDDASEPDFQDRLFLTGMEEIDATLLRSDNFRIGIRTRGEARDTGDQVLVTGDDTLDVGAFGEFTFDQWTLSASLGQGLGERSGGFAGDLGLKWATRFSDSWAVRVGPEFSWASDDYIAGLENFTPRQRIPGRGLQLSESEPGAREVGISGSVKYSISDSWTVGGKVGAQRMVGDTTDKADPEEENEYFGGISLGIRF